MKRLTVSILLCLLVAFAGIPVNATFFQCSLRTQGYLGGCDNIYVRWFDQNTALNYRLDYSDGFSVTVPGNRQDWSRAGVGCGWGGQVRITGLYGTGGTCTVQYSGNLPHNRPCDQCVGQGTRPLGISHAANGRAYGAPGMIASAYATGLSTVTASATSLPLPRNLGGVRLTMGFDDEIECGLFYVSPNQINFLIPDEAPLGLVRFRATNTSGQSFAGEFFLTGQAPGVFTRDGTGSGAAAALFFPSAVVLYASGINPAALVSSAEVRVRTRGVDYPAFWVGNAPGFAGLVQINVLMPSSAIGSGASLFVNGAESQGFLLVR